MRHILQENYQNATFKLQTHRRQNLRESFWRFLLRVTENLKTTIIKVCYFPRLTIRCIFAFLRYLSEIDIKGRSRFFDMERLYTRPATTYEIWSLKNMPGSQTKQWIDIGQWGYSGLAIDSFITPEGQLIRPPVKPPRPTLKIPVNLYTPWVIEEDIYDGEICLRGGLFCYRYVNKINSSLETKTKRCCYGVSIDMLKVLKQELKFETEIYFTRDGRYGIYNQETGEWNGMVRELVDGHADMAIDLSLSEARERAIDFAHPLFPIGLNILVKKVMDGKEGNLHISFPQLRTDVAMLLIII